MNLWILSVHAAAVIVVSIAHYGTKLVSSLREYPVSSERRTCSDDRFHRCLPVDANINRYLVYLGTFIHVSYAFMRKIQNTEYWSSRIMLHHRMDGQLMSHSQEEMALIGIFALFWIGEHSILHWEWSRRVNFIIVLLVAWRFFTNKQSNMSTVTDPAIRSAGGLKGKDFCSGEGIYCIYEEYAMF